MLKKIVTIMNVVMVILVLFFIGFTFVYSAEEVRAFYYISVIFEMLFVKTDLSPLVKSPYV